MTQALKSFPLIYVGTPYSKYPDGIEAAFVDACKFTARLLREGLNVYSPIAHTHPIALYGKIDPFNHRFWLDVDAALMAKSNAMIVAMMDGWATSVGVHHEIQTFVEVGKPVYLMRVDDLSYTLLGAK